ncbi:MAG: hypothetical protein KGJ41_06105 [Rhodospirillales bacterium]|nr:hypothetical protein [Rhodospirillales bacterium]MDE2575482.1 hypothetical protein [Rhodospirillales bacterium]
MRLKLYRAATVQEAMAQIRGELGPDALIMQTRRLAGGVEIAAALEGVEAVAPPPADLAESLRSHGVGGRIADGLCRGALPFALTAMFRFARLDFASGAAPLLLVGPPGGGKTLTAARLATRLVLEGAPPLVITADGRRAGAVEQLSAFTRLLGLALLSASTPAALARAIAQRQHGQPVLIDAPGLDAIDPAQLREIAALAEAGEARPAVVLPAGLDPHEAADQAAAHLAAGASFLIATKLDISRRLGGILAAADAGLALAEAGIGPGAADGLTPLTAALLARRLQRRVPSRAAPHA